MNFGFDEQQDLLRESVRKFLDEQCPLSEVRTIAASEHGYSPDLWKQISELGWPGLIMPEMYGGSGLGFVDLVVLLEEVGRTLFPSPLIPTLLAAETICDAGNDEQCARWLPGIAAGTTLATQALFDSVDLPTPIGITLNGVSDGDGYVLSGEKSFVASATSADLFVVGFRTGTSADAVSLAVVDARADGVTVDPRKPLDTTKRHATLRLDGVRVSGEAVLGAPGAGWAAIQRAFDRGAVAVTAEGIGSAMGMLDMTVQYAKDRVQFGSPIGRYQGVKHPLAEAYVDIECMKSLTYYAAWALDDSPDEVSLAVSRAKGFASEAVNRIGVTGIQLHGAVGYTEEYDVHLYLRRGKWLRPEYGDEDFHYDRALTLGGL
jgi:alkylation response protein AidB-like acyl-CoA dehydrogenase